MADRFCSQCGAELVEGARFCISCGRALSGAGGVRSGPLRIGRWAPLAVFGAVLVAGAAAVLAGRSNPVPAPAIPGGGGGGPMGGGAAPPLPGGGAGNPGAMPEGHPSIEIPEDVVKAIDDMKKQADAAPDDLALWSRLAGVQYRAGLIDKRYLPDATKSFDHVLERDPKNLDALRHLGNIAFDQELPVRAIDYYVRYLALKPDDNSVITDMATMYLSRGDARTAIQFYEQVLAKQPDFFEAQFNLGIAYRTAGDVPKATAAFEKAKSIAPDDRAKQQVDQMLARVGAPDAVPQGSGAPPPGSAPAAGGAPAVAGFRPGVESIFRNHPMIGPKLDTIEWDGDEKVRVNIREFPMQGMPPEIKQRFLDRIRTQVRERKSANQVTAQVSIELIDPATGSVMETIVE